ncbi:pentapeptide repeat-containing protein [Amycolatopsis suaedae]|uniref:Pentapeptide repeat-containing protein n=1 Tax=Amycolatopsis suaedae TaxID=2510978 RepID=A0A4V2EMR3_9PSEU|nr:pentapeptide repeat-containing protein [Amycolatopsis suaedae]RZQ66005.1 pentapeptide repeat-containing protein [Amycolatopsis suaedae]
MVSRTLDRGLRVRRPDLDEDLPAGPATFDDEFELHGTRVDHADVEVPDAVGTLAKVIVGGTSLAGSRFGKLELEDSRFEATDLSNAAWPEVVARRVEFLRCRGVGWRCDFALAGDVYLQGCRLDYAMIDVKRVRGLLVLDDCSLREASLSGDLSKVVFTGCDLTGADFQATVADGCDLRGSTLDRVRGLLNLRGAKIDPQQLMAVAAQLATSAGLVIVED